MQETFHHTSCPWLTSAQPLSPCSWPPGPVTCTVRGTPAGGQGPLASPLRPWEPRAAGCSQGDAASLRGESPSEKLRPLSPWERLRVCMCVHVGVGGGTLAALEKEPSVDTAISLEATWDRSPLRCLTFPYDRGIVISKRKIRDSLLCFSPVVS